MTDDSNSNGSADRGPLRRMLPGPTPRADATACLVAGWDRTPASSGALRYAVDMAHRLTAHIHVVHIVDLDDMPIDPDAPDWGDQLRATITGEAAAARELLDGLAASWTYHTGHGDPAELLSLVADTYSALGVVIGSPRGGLISFVDTVLGQSVTHRLIGKRHTPLWLVPTDAAPSESGR